MAAVKKKKLKERGRATEKKKVLGWRVLRESGAAAVDEETRNGG